MFEIPQIKLTLEHMRQEITHAFAARASGLTEEIDKALDEAIKKFDFNAEVEQMATGILREQIRKSLERAFDCLKWDESVRAAVVAHIKNELCKP